MVNDKFYTYIYYDPSRNNEPIYVGKGHGSRAWDHLTSSKSGPFINRLRCMKADSINPIIGIYAGFDEELSHLVEMELISKFGRRNLGKGPLLNLTDGGEGQTGLIHTAETRQKMSLAHRGVLRSEETKRKISISTTGKPKSEEHKLNISISNKGKIRGPTSEIVKEKLSIANTGKKRTQETCNRISLAQSGANHPNFGKTRSKDIVEKIKESNTGKKRSTESKQRMAEAQRKRFEDPKQREQISKTKQEKKNARQRENE